MVRYSGRLANQAKRSAIYADRLRSLPRVNRADGRPPQHRAVLAGEPGADREPPGPQPDEPVPREIVTSSRCLSSRHPHDGALAGQGSRPGTRAPAAGRGHDRPKPSRGYMARTRQVRERSAPGTPDSCHRRLLLTLWYLIPGQKVKNRLSAAISVGEGRSGRAGPGRAAPSSLAAGVRPPVRSGGNQG